MTFIGKAPGKFGIVRSVDDPRPVKATSVAPATPASTEPPKADDEPYSEPPRSGSENTPLSEQLLLDATANGPGTTPTPDSLSFDVPVLPSKKRYTSPTTAVALASLVTQVATQVLNDEIDLDKARVFSGLVRTAAQAMSTEVARARSEKQIAALELDPEGMYE